MLSSSPSSHLGGPHRRRRRSWGLTTALLHSARMSPYEARLFTSAERLERTAGGGLWRKKKKRPHSFLRMGVGGVAADYEKKVPVMFFFFPSFFFPKQMAASSVLRSFAPVLSLPCTGGWRCRLLILSLLGRCVWWGRGCWPRPSPVITAQMGEGGRHAGILGKQSPSRGASGGRGWTRGRSTR